MKIKGSDLIFISQIGRTGTYLTPISEISREYIELLQREKFYLRPLSISQMTYIASGFNSWVVKIKPKDVL